MSVRIDAHRLQSVGVAAADVESQHTIEESILDGFRNMM
jgi:hypothetical protein